MAVALRSLQGRCMSLYTSLVSGLLFPMHESLKGHSSVAVMRAMERSQWLSAREIERMQIERLREFLSRIGADVPYYRDLFATLAFDPKALTALRELQRLPLTGKADIRANIESLRAVNAGKLERFTTGGSSGEPLVFYRGKERVSHDVAAKWRATRWWHVDIGDPEIAHRIAFRLRDVRRKSAEISPAHKEAQAAHVVRLSVLTCTAGGLCQPA
jgi:phenylacetate-CoA ligase